MRIAITGTHGTGKTTLMEDFVSADSRYESVPEPYWLLVQQGTPFASGPTTTDLEEQLDLSCSLILASAAAEHVVLDRCPLDFIAYLEVVGAQEGFEWSPHGKLLSRIGRALSALDLVVFVPLLLPDDVRVSIEYPRLRSRVDARLKKMLRHDDLGLLERGPCVLEVSGAREERVRRVLAAIGDGPGSAGGLGSQ